MDVQPWEARKATEVMKDELRRYNQCHVSIDDIIRIARYHGTWDRSKWTTAVPDDIVIKVV